MIAFIDIEASSLSEHSYPIEVGWVTEDGTTESHLIQPLPTWTDWDDVAEQVHCISREVLAAQGIPAADVALRLAEALNDCTIYSDAPTSDQVWLARLLATAGLAPMTVEHVSDMYMSACIPIVDRMPGSVAAGLCASLLRQADKEAFLAVPQMHRAADDARRLWATWKRMEELVAEALDGWPG